MSILAALLLLAPIQRASVAASPAIQTGRFQVVTTSWLRMHDPAFIQRLAGFHQPGFVSPLQPFELKMASASLKGINANLNALKYGELIKGLSIYQKHDAAVDFGEVVQDSGETSYYEDLATQDGTLTVQQILKSPFRVQRIVTYLGTMPSGKMKEDKSFGNEVTGTFTLPVRAGQAYRIEYTFGTGGLAPSTYTATNDVSVGAPMEVTLAGDAVPATGKLQVSKDVQDVVLTPGRPLTFNLLVTAQGNTKTTKLDVEPNNADVAKYRTTLGKILPVTLKNGETATIPITLNPDQNQDMSGTYHLTLKSYDGKRTTKYAFPITILNQWMDTGILVSTKQIALLGNVGTQQQTTFRRFRMCASGYWEYSAQGAIDNDILQFVMDSPLNGHKYGVLDPKWAYDGGCFGVSDEIAKAFDTLRGSLYNLSEARFVGQQVSVGDDYNALVAAHEAFKQQGMVDLNDDEYIKGLKYMHP